MVTPDDAEPCDRGVSKVSRLGASIVAIVMMEHSLAVQGSHRSLHRRAIAAEVKKFLDKHNPV
jgi:hypothetical protein